MRVDPYGSCLELLRDLASLVEVLAPDRCTKSVDSVVGSFNDVFLVAPLEKGNDGT